MTETLGRREQNKLATRRALQQAAERLFAEHGFEQTTVRDIADEAGVTERTFFRYFAGKDDLIVDRVLAWLPVLQERIRNRPAEEDPLTAVREALTRSDRRITTSMEGPLWLFKDGTPEGRLAGSGPRILLRTEAALAEVIRERLDRSGATDHDQTAYLADTYARVALALLRSILIRAGQVQTVNQQRKPSMPALIDQAFSTVHR